MPQKRTRGGVTITNESGVWRTSDGKYEISRVFATTFCEGAHPERFRDHITGHLVSGYCEGNKEHEYGVGWGVFDQNGNEVTEEPDPTFNGAFDALVGHLNRRT